MHRLCQDERASVTMFVDGAAMEARLGDNVAVALGLNGFLRLRASPRGGTARGALCFMGACQECAIHIDGSLRQACQTLVAEGMKIELRGAP